MSGSGRHGPLRTQQPLRGQTGVLPAYPTSARPEPSCLHLVGLRRSLVRQWGPLHTPESSAHEQTAGLAASAPLIGVSSVRRANVRPILRSGMPEPVGLMPTGSDRVNFRAPRRAFEYGSLFPIAAPRIVQRRRSCLSSRAPTARVRIIAPVFRRFRLSMSRVRLDGRCSVARRLRLPHPRPGFGDNRCCPGVGRLPCCEAVFTGRDSQPGHRRSFRSACRRHFNCTCQRQSPHVWQAQ